MCLPWRGKYDFNQIKSIQGATILLLRLEPVLSRTLLSKLIVDINGSILLYNSSTSSVFGLSKFYIEDAGINSIKKLLNEDYQKEFKSLPLDAYFVKNNSKVIGPVKVINGRNEKDVHTKVTSVNLATELSAIMFDKIFLLECWLPDISAQLLLAASPTRRLLTVRPEDREEGKKAMIGFSITRGQAIIGTAEDMKALQNENVLRMKATDEKLTHIAGSYQKKRYGEDVKVKRLDSEGRILDLSNWNHMEYEEDIQVELDKRKREEEERKKKKEKEQEKQIEGKKEDITRQPSQEYSLTSGAVTDDIYKKISQKPPSPKFWYQTYLLVVYTSIFTAVMVVTVALSVQSHQTSKRLTTASRSMQQAAFEVAKISSLTSNLVMVNQHLLLGSQATATIQDKMVSSVFASVDRLADLSTLIEQSLRSSDLSDISRKFSVAHADHQNIFARLSLLSAGIISTKRSATNFVMTNPDIASIVANVTSTLTLATDLVGYIRDSMSLDLGSSISRQMATTEILMFAFVGWSIISFLLSLWILFATLRAILRELRLTCGFDSKDFHDLAETAEKIAAMLNPNSDKVHVTNDQTSQATNGFASNKKLKGNIFDRSYLQVGLHFFFFLKSVVFLVAVKYHLLLTLQNQALESHQQFAPVTAGLQAMQTSLAVKLAALGLAHSEPAQIPRLAGSSICDLYGDPPLDPSLFETSQQCVTASNLIMNDHGLAKGLPVFMTRLNSYLNSTLTAVRLITSKGLMPAIDTSCSPLDLSVTGNRDTAVSCLLSSSSFAAAGEIG